MQTTKNAFPNYTLKQNKSQPVNPIIKSELNPTSLRAAVNAHCYVCCGGDRDDKHTSISVYQLIASCRSEVCPLLNLRPIQGASGGVDELN